MTRAFKAALHPGTWVPPFGKMLVDDDGVVWLQRSDESSWLVLDDSARIVGQVSLPKQNIAFAVRGEQLWTMQFDEFDVPELVRYRVRKAGHAP